MLRLNEEVRKVKTFLEDVGDRLEVHNEPGKVHAFASKLRERGFELITAVYYNGHLLLVGEDHRQKKGMRGIILRFTPQDATALIRNAVPTKTHDALRRADPPFKLYSVNSIVIGLNTANPQHHSVQLEFPVIP